MLVIASQQAPLPKHLFPNTFGRDRAKGLCHNEPSNHPNESARVICFLSLISPPDSRHNGCRRCYRARAIASWCVFGLALLSSVHTVTPPARCNWRTFMISACLVCRAAPNIVILSRAVVVAPHVPGTLFYFSNVFFHSVSFPSECFV